MTKWDKNESKVGQIRPTKEVGHCLSYVGFITKVGQICPLDTDFQDLDTSRPIPKTKYLAVSQSPRD